MTIQFETWSELVAMGGHGAFVWSAYSLALMVLLVSWLLPFVQHKRRLKTLINKHRTQSNTVQDTHDAH